MAFIITLSILTIIMTWLSWFFRDKGFMKKVYNEDGSVEIKFYGFLQTTEEEKQKMIDAAVKQELDARRS